MKFNKRLQFKDSLIEQLSFPLIAFTFFLIMIIVFLLFSFISREKKIYIQNSNEHISVVNEWMKDYINYLYQNKNIIKNILEVKSIIEKDSTIPFIDSYFKKSIKNQTIKDNILRISDERKISIIYEKGNENFIVFFPKNKTEMTLLYAFVPVLDIYRGFISRSSIEIESLNLESFPDALEVYNQNTFLGKKNSFVEKSGLQNVLLLFQHENQDNVLKISYRVTPFQEGSTSILYVSIGCLLILILILGYYYQYYIIKKTVIEPLETIKSVLKLSKSPKDIKKISLDVDNEIKDIADALIHVSTDLDSLYKNLEVRVFEKTKELEKTLTDLHEKFEEDDVLLREMNDGILVLSGEGVILKSNKRSKEIFKDHKILSIGDILLENTTDSIYNLRDLFFQFKSTREKRGLITSYENILSYREKESDKLIPLFITCSVLPKENNTSEYLFLIRDISEEISLAYEKNEFVSFASHQLKTPMTNISWISEGIISGMYGNVNQELIEPLSDIHTSMKKMIGIVNTLLQVSRLEMGVLLVYKKEINVSDIINESIELHVEQLKKKEINVQFLTTEKKVFFDTDPKILKIIIDNLIGNAIKYSKEKSNIEIKLSLIENKMIISISDSGIGIPEKDKKNIFKKMYRASNVESAHEGSGLGLYMVDLMMRRLGGSIIFHSKENIGTEFIVSLEKEEKAL